MVRLIITLCNNVWTTESYISLLLMPPCVEILNMFIVSISCLMARDFYCQKYGCALFSLHFSVHFSIIINLSD